MPRDTKFLQSKADSNKPYTDRTYSEGRVDSNGDLVYYYADPLTYSYTSDSNGDVAAFKVTTGVTAHEYNSQTTLMP